MQGVLVDPREFISSHHTLVRVWVLLKLFCQEQFAARSVCETPTREFNHTSAISLHSSLFLLVSSIRRQGLAFVARSIMQRMVNNQRRSGAVIAGFESC